MLILKNLNFAYGKKQVFDNLNLELHAGHIYGLLGSNGMGKSTLLRTLTGLLLPQRGSILVNEHIPGHRTPAFLQQIFFLPEDFLLPDIIIDSFANTTAPFYPQFNRQHFHQYLEEFAIAPDQRLPRLSYGQQKKVLISFGLACHTPFLFMDEPTNGLDMQSKRTFRKLIAGAVDENTCIVISTHQVKDLENLLDQVMVMAQGKMVFNESISSIQDALAFKIAGNEAEVTQALYAEKNLAGHSIVANNTGQESYHVDLELLHKAIIENPVGMQKAFTTILQPSNSF